MTGEGATLVECLFCGAAQVRLKWVPGHGWSCPVCLTNTKGVAHETSATEVHQGVHSTGFRDRGDGGG